MSDSETTADMDSEILDWYHGLHNRMLDLVGDYAGNERFLLEGDSLLLHCFEDMKIDVEGKLVRLYRCSCLRSR